jgi:hypothetical protein
MHKSFRTQSYSDTDLCFREYNLINIAIIIIIIIIDGRGMWGAWGR